MSDERLRTLERVYLESGAVEDHATWLQEQIRQGVLELDRVRVAAWLNHKAAQLALGEPGAEFITTRLLGAEVPMLWGLYAEFSPPVLRRFCMVAVIMLRVRSYLPIVHLAVPFETPHPDHIGLWARAQALHDLGELERTRKVWECLFGVGRFGVSAGAQRFLTGCQDSTGWCVRGYQCWVEELMLPWLLGQREQFHLQCALAQGRAR